jgi:hypothetical protein
VARTPLSSDLHLEPISSPTGSILDMVEDAAEEMFDTVPGTSRAALAEDAMRTSEMDQATLDRLLPQTRPVKDAATVAMRGPRTDTTEPQVPVEAAPPLPVPEPRGIGVKVFVGFAVFASMVAALWFFG